MNPAFRERPGTPTSVGRVHAPELASPLPDESSVPRTPPARRLQSAGLTNRNWRRRCRINPAFREHPRNADFSRQGSRTVTGVAAAVQELGSYLSIYLLN